MSNPPMDPRDRTGYHDDAPTAPRGYDAPRDRGVYGNEAVVERSTAYPVAARNGAGTAALVLGIIGLLLSPVLVGGVLGVVAVVLAMVGLGRVNRREATNRGSAIAGVVLGLVAIAVSLTVVVFAYKNRDNVNNLSDCLKGASTVTEQTACRDKFAKAVTK